jgi:uncharacterized damage-inducible protein DinB
MTIAEVQQLFAYNRWANDRILSATAVLSAEQFGRDMASSFPSVAATLAHILAAEWVWLSRWNGESPAGLPSDWGDDTHADLVSRWRRHEADQSRFLDSLDPARLAAPLSYRNTKGEPFIVPLEHLLRHVINHSTYHRGQVTTMLRQLGVPASATDYVLYCTTVAALQPAQ